MTRTLKLPPDDTGAPLLLRRAVQLVHQSGFRHSFVSRTTAAGIAVSVALGHSVLPIGIAQRLAAACLLAWLAILGWRLGRR